MKAWILLFLATGISGCGSASPADIAVSASPVISDTAPITPPLPALVSSIFASWTQQGGAVALDFSGNSPGDLDISAPIEISFTSCISGEPTGCAANTSTETVSGVCVQHFSISGDTAAGTLDVNAPTLQSDPCPSGPMAIGDWNDPAYFNSEKCEEQLPVDCVPPLPVGEYQYQVDNGELSLCDSAAHCFNFAVTRP